MTATKTPASAGADTARAEQRGTLVLPFGVKPSECASRDASRLVLTHGALVERGDDLWLCTTDAYVACGVEIRDRNNLTPGLVPRLVLRHLEKQGRTGPSAVVQLSELRWRIDYPDHSIEAWAAEGKYPDLTTAGLWDAVPESGCSDVGVNPAYLLRASRAIGATEGVRVVTSASPVRPVHLLSRLAGRLDRRAIIMPLRLDV